MDKINRFLFQTKDILFFIIWWISWFWLNILTSSLTWSLIWWVLIFFISIFLFFFYKKWLWGIDEFEYYVIHSNWNKFWPKDIWICEDNNDYQLELWECMNDRFKEKWSDKTLDNENNASYKLYVKKNWVIIREFTWCYLDWYRIFMPLPEVKSWEYFIKTKSLQYKMFLKIWLYWRFFMNPNDVLKSLSINII